jgi:hypothetical protein
MGLWSVSRKCGSIDLICFAQIVCKRKYVSGGIDPCVTYMFNNNERISFRQSE